MRFDDRVEAALARPAVAVAAIVAATAWLLWPVPLAAPVSQDHTVHLFRAWHFFTKVLAQGRLTAWSDYWFAGWPAGMDYPPGADFWLAATRLVTLPFSWETTYAVGFFAMFALTGVALWRCARALGPVAALLGALLFLLDRGEYREGGFSYSVHWGVWPQQLAMAALLLGLTWLDEAIATGHTRDLGKAAAAVGWALVCHPLALVSLCVGLPVVVVAHRVLAGTPLRRSAARAAGVALMGYGLAAFFLVPFAARSGWMSAYGDLYRPLGAIALGLLRGDLFAGVPAPLCWLALCGLGLGIWRRDRTAVVLGGFALATLLVASSTVIEALEKVSPSFGRIQYQRLVAPAKACLFVLAAWALAPGFGPRPVRRVGFASLVLVPLLLVRAAPPPRVRTASATREAQAYREYLDWSRAERARSRDFYRIAYVAPYNDHFFAAAPVYNDTPAYKVGFTPASNFVHKPDQASRDLYRSLSVKWVVSRGPLRDPTLHLVRRFGPIQVHRFAEYSPQRFTLFGPGRARAERFETEHVRLALDGTGGESRVVLHVASFFAWRARLDGREVPIRTVSWAGEPIFMEVPAGGRLLELDFDAGFGAGHAASLLACAVLAFLIARPDAADRMPGSHRLGPALAATLAVGLLGTVLWRVYARPTPPRWRAVDHVTGATAVQDGVPCARDGDRLRCSDRSWNHVAATELRIGGVRTRCVWAHPRATRPLSVTFADTPGGDWILRHGLADSAVDAARDGASVRVDVTASGQLLGSGLQPNRKGWFLFRGPRAAPGDLTATISAPRDGARHFCFDLELR
jgi:hypothetical protein